MHFTPVELFFWAVSFTLYVLLAILLSVRRRAHSFPFFTALVWSNIVEAVILYVVAASGNKHSYLVAYFCLAILDGCFQFAVTWEVAAHILPVGGWGRETRSGVILVIALSLSIALLLAAMPVPPEKYPLKAALDRAMVFCSALQCELFLVIMAISVRTHLPWKTHTAAIAKGLGVFSIVNLIAAAGHAVVGLNVTQTLSWYLTVCRVTAVFAMMIYWMVALWQDAPTTEPLTEELRHQLVALQGRLEYDLRKLRLLKR